LQLTPLSVDALDRSGGNRASVAAPSQFRRSVDARDCGRGFQVILVGRDDLPAQSLTPRSLCRCDFSGDLLRSDRHPLYAFHEIRVAKHAKRFQELQYFEQQLVHGRVLGSEFKHRLSEAERLV